MILKVAFGVYVIKYFSTFQEHLNICNVLSANKAGFEYNMNSNHIWSTHTFLKLFSMYLKKRQHKRSSVCGFTLHMPATVTARPERTQQSGFKSVPQFKAASLEKTPALLKGLPELTETLPTQNISSNQHLKIEALSPQCESRNLNCDKHH